MNAYCNDLQVAKNLCPKKICGERASLHKEVCDEWKIELLILLVDQGKDVFNADERGLFQVSTKREILWRKTS